MATLTKPQRKLLLRLNKRALFVIGPDVRVARNLERLGLATLRDEGPLGPSGNVDGERWFAKITDAGRAAIAEVSP